MADVSKHQRQYFKQCIVLIVYRKTNLTLPFDRPKRHYYRKAILMGFGCHEQWALRQERECFANL